MSVALSCSQCRRPASWAGPRGLCARCLFSHTTEQLLAGELNIEPSSEPQEIWDFGQSVGPGKRFLLLERLGEGGMGEVWLASDQELSSPGEPEFVALKFLAPRIQNDPTALAALRSEVLRTQRLTHNNIVRVFDLHTSERGTPFIKMEFVEGNSLKHWLDERNGQPMPWRMAAALSQQLAAALHYAHQNEGIVHRDLKPANLLLAAGSTLKLTDFGIAAVIRERTGSFEVAGTLGYAGPQQIAGLAPRPQDDVYSFGVTLYELLSGALPFNAESVEEMMHKVQYEPPIPLLKRLRDAGSRVQVPSTLVRLVQQCLEKDPLLRPTPLEISRQLPQVTAADVAKVMSRYEQPHEEWTDHTRHTPLTDEAIDDSQTTAPRYKSGAAVLLLLAAMALGAMVWSQHWKGMPTFSTTKPTSNPLLRSDNISPPTETKNPNAEATTALAPIIDGGGRGAVHLSLAQTSFYETPPFRYEFTRLGKVVTNGSFWKVEGDVVSLPAGDYHVTLVSKRLTWKLENAVQVVGGQTNQLPLTFAVGNLVVETEPSGATVKWSRTKNRLESDPNSAIAPFHNSFRSGAVVFRATRHGYEDTIATNFFYPMRTGSPTNFSIRLKPKPVPQLFETFSNSLGMTFHAIAQDTWISAFETRVRDFRQFVLETGSSDITNGMLSVTRDGLQPMGHSWEDPGPHFFQEDNHPVIGVNWDDALRFCIWLTQHEKDAGHLLPCQSYRLPTTNEWFAMTEPKQQYVISVDSVNFPRFPWGNTTNEIHGNYSGVEVTAGVWPPSWPVLSGYRDGFIRTAPVDDPAFPPISIGQDRFFYHVGGNAAEWCEGKVLCGGSWGDGEDGNLQFLETKNVYHPPEPLQRNDRNGFRVVIFDRDVQSPNEL